MRVKVCFHCKQYTPIHPGNITSDFFVEEFLGWHGKHPVQTIDLIEVPKDFQRITPQNREKAYAHLASMRIKGL